MAKPKNPDNVPLRFPRDYQRSCFANRFKVERHPGFTLASFGLVLNKNKVVFRCSFILTDNMLHSQKDNLVPYSEKIGQPKTDIPKWDIDEEEDQAAAWAASFGGFSTYSVVDFIKVSNWDEREAEFCFCNVARGPLTESIQFGEQQISLHGILFLRCNIDLQRAFLMELYSQ